MIENGCAVLNDLHFTFLAGGPSEGAPVILLHGFPQFADVWSHLIEDLSAGGFRAIAPDQRGYAAGARPLGINEYSVRELSSDVIALADSLGWSSFHLIGHDWGGFLGWKLAAERASRILSLTVLSTAHVDAFLDAVSADTDQKTRSRYIEFFRMQRPCCGSNIPAGRWCSFAGCLSGKNPAAAGFGECTSTLGTRGAHRRIELVSRSGSQRSYRASERPNSLHLGRSGSGSGTGSG
jgi:pimeloyl-ACP methyl ester carboxylesterase